MVKVALLVRLEAKPGKEADVEKFLRSGLPLVEEEPKTTAWFGLRLGPSTFGIFDAFPDESGRHAHLSGKVAAALVQKSARVFCAVAQHREGGRACRQASRLTLSCCGQRPKLRNHHRGHPPVKDK